jgi:crossover junction endodeoxyribonuclease RuvC
MIILGIDPGTVRAGYGVIRAEAGRVKLLAAGILRVSSTQEKADALEQARASVEDLCAKHRPAMLAIEKLYFSKNQKTAFAVAEARGVILLAARAAGLVIQEYSPTEVKANLTGYGGADKKAVLKMVRLILRAPDLEVVDDASDALALALVAAQDLRNKA